MTISQCIDKIAKLLNYFSVAGNIISGSDGTATDYRLRAVSLIDTAQKELCVHFPLKKSITMSQHRYKNLLPERNLIDIGEQTVFAVSGGQALTFVTDGKLRVTVERMESDGWRAYASLETRKYACFQKYTLRFEAYDAQRVVFTSMEPGATVYVGNAAVYDTHFDSDEEVPPRVSYYSHALPDDFYRFEDVTFTPTPKSSVQRDVPYCIGWRTFDVVRDFDGTFLLTYSAMCPTVDETTPTDTHLPLDEHLCELIPYYAAAVMSADDNSMLSSQLMSIYRTKVMNLDMNEAVHNIKNQLYGGGVRGVQ